MPDDLPSLVEIRQQLISLIELTEWKMTEVAKRPDEPT
jgi:hypothetical protein